MKLDRLVAIIMVLLEHEKISAKNLAEMFEVSPRTIYRDLDTINRAGIPICSTAGPGGGAEILKTYKIEKRLFSVSDVTTLLMGLGSIPCNLPSNTIIETLAKVKGFIPLEKQREFDFQAKRIKLDSVPWVSCGNLSDSIALLKTALEQNRILRFDYSDFRNRKSSREIEPYRLLLKGEEWYIQGYCLTREDYRTFKLLRMQNACISSQTFETRNFPFEEMDSARFHDQQITSAKLRIHESVRDLIISRFGEDCLTPDGPEYDIADIHLPIDDLACNYILGFGDKCICLEPENLRDEMRKISERIFNFYC